MIRPPPDHTLKGRTVESSKITRAMNVSLDEQQVLKLCETNALRISAIEPLVSGGTHLVLVTIEEADQARYLMRKEIITGSVKRTPFIYSRQR